jgi:hypothetical protein
MIRRMQLMRTGHNKVYVLAKILETISVAATIRERTPRKKTGNHRYAPPSPLQKAIRMHRELQQGCQRDVRGTSTA